MAKQKHAYDYLPPDETFTVNDGDPDLKPITVNIFDVIKRNFLLYNPNHEGSIPILKPKWKKCRNYGLHPKEQFWWREERPERLLKLEKKMGGHLDRIWKYLSDNKNEYAEELRFIRKHWYHRIYGEWIFIRGKLTYIDGWHWWFLNYWQGDFEGFDRKSGKKRVQEFAEYRDVDRRVFLFYKFAYLDTQTFEKVDKYGAPIPSEDGQINMIDLGRRVCLGVARPKGRRAGETERALAVKVCVTTMLRDIYSSMIANAENTTRTHFDEKLTRSYRRIPFYFKAVHDGSDRPKRKYDFKQPTYSRREKEKAQTNDYYYSGELGSLLDYADIADRAYYDHSKITGIILLDEQGKCLGRDTLVKMADGSNVTVQDVKPGDLLMGDDKSSRTVLSTCKGWGPLYRIIPNKGEPWICNDEHILSLKQSYAAGKGWKKNNIMDISVKDFLKLTPSQRKAAMLWKAAIDYPEKHLLVDPYFLGLWLGDGTATGTQITSNDRDVEVFEWLKEFVKERGLAVKLSFNSENSTILHISDPISKKTNRLLNDMRFIGVIGNKHIPKDYLVNSEYNRLQLLGGLLDSDGSRFPHPHTGYDFIQKDRELSYQIVELARSLGFSVNISPKTGTIKTLGFSGQYYRISIYGNDLYRIPCKVERKKHYNLPRHVNSRNPMRCGFTVEAIGEGEYFGFVIDGNRRFLLGDYTVTHNTLSTNIFDGWDKVKPTMTLGGGSTINRYAFSFHPSTVDEMELKGGDNYKKLCDASNFHVRNPVSGQTASGLYVLFIPSYDGLENFVGPYGESIIDTPDPEQAKYIGRKIGAMQFLDETLAFLKTKNTEEGRIQAENFPRLYPKWYADCWRIKGGDMGFNKEKMNERLTELRRLRQAGTPAVVQGDLKYRIPGEADLLSAAEFRRKKYHVHVLKNLKVEFVPCEEGRFLMSRLFGKHEACRMQWNHSFGFFEPIEPVQNIACADPVQFHSETDVKLREDKSRSSWAAGAVFWDYDESNPDSNRFIISYMNKPDDHKEYLEEMLMMCIYSNAKMFPETNIPTVLEFFEERRYGGYLKYAFDIVTGQYKTKAGFQTGTGSGNKNELFSLLKDYIENHVYKERHEDLIMQWLTIRRKEEMTKFDLFVSSAGCLYGQHLSYREMDEEPVDINNNGGEKFNMKDWYPSAR